MGEMVVEKRPPTCSAILTSLEAMGKAMHWGPCPLTEA